MKTKLSININKVATIRNARGNNMPNVVKFALDCETFGAQGITVHPRPDERHIKYADVYDLKKVVTSEFNIEGYPCESFIDLVCKVKPTQVTLVPDPPEALTSNSGWDTLKNRTFLNEVCTTFKKEGIRVSIFVNADPTMVEAAALCGTDRIELYTEPYAANYTKNAATAIQNFVVAARKAQEVGLGLNAGHDLNLVNLHYFAENIPELAEVSIGHALICDALYLGIKKTIQEYLNCLK